MKKLFVVVLFLSFVLAPLGQALAADLVIYSSRKEEMLKPLFDAYSRETGATFSYVTGKAGDLIKRLAEEGRETPADLLITSDAGNLWHASYEGVLQPVYSKVLDTNIPEHLRCPQKRWFGLSMRARTIVYNTERVDPKELSTYAELGDEKWRSKLLLRTSEKVYNQSLVAMMIAEKGEEETETIVRSWVENLAKPPVSNDSKVMEAIVAGEGDVGLVNTYYYGRLMRKNPDLKLALFWPNQESSGVHVNVSGAGVIRYAKHRREAVEFLEWLSSEKAQNLFADADMEYPVNPRCKACNEVAAWGNFKKSHVNLANAGEFQLKAIALMEKAGYE